MLLPPRVRGADGGARAQLRVLLALACGPGTTAKAARFARPPHPALRATFSRRREKGCFPSAGGRWAFRAVVARGALTFPAAARASSTGRPPARTWSARRSGCSRGRPRQIGREAGERVVVQYGALSGVSWT